MGAKYTKLAMFSLAALSAGALYATDYYWVGGASGNSSDAVWATTSDGSGETHSFTTSDKFYYILESTASDCSGMTLDYLFNEPTRGGSRCRN